MKNETNKKLKKGRDGAENLAKQVQRVCVVIRFILNASLHLSVDVDASAEVTQKEGQST